MIYPDTVTVADRLYKPAGLTVPRWSGWRGLHKSEGGRPTPEGQPCVIPSVNATSIPFTAAMQHLAWDLMRRWNELLSTNNFRSVFAGDTAYTNFNGWDNAKEPNDIRADYVNRRDIGAPLPKLMKAIICAGSFTTGQRISGEIVCIPGVDGIDANKPLPTADEVLRRGWYFHAVIGWTAADKSWRVGHFGTKGAVIIPRFLRAVTAYPIAWFTPWEGDQLPDPLRVYL